MKNISLIVIIYLFTSNSSNAQIVNTFSTFTSKSFSRRFGHNAYIGKNDSNKFIIRKTDTNTIVSLKLDRSSNFGIIDSVFFSGIYFHGSLESKPKFLFRNSLIIVSSKFSEPLVLKYYTFQKAVVLNGSNFKRVNFSDCVFNGDLAFRDVNFDPKYVDSFEIGHGFLSYSRRYGRGFNGSLSADFRDAIFKGQVHFGQTHFRKGLDISGAEFYHVPNFDRCTLPSFINFMDVKFHFNNLSDVNTKIDFRNTFFDKLTETAAPKCTINITGTDASKFILPFEMFELRFEESATYEERASTYEEIINSCKIVGMTESAQNWDIEYRKLQIHHDWPRIGTSIIKFNEYWWNFGYEKWRILLRWLPLLFLLFYSINILVIEWLHTSVYQDNEIGKTFMKKGEKLTLNKLSYRVSYTLFYTAIIYFGLKLRHESVNYKNIWGLLYLYLIYIIGAIHVAFALSYILSAY